MTTIELNKIIDNLCPRLDKPTRDRIVFDSWGNPGATKVLTAIAANYVDWEYLFSRIEDADIHGAEIWVLYKDLNKESIESTVSYIRNRTPGAMLRAVMRHV